MSELSDFLQARFAEDEERAKRAAFGWGREWTDVTDDLEEWSTVHADGKRDMVGCEDRDVTRHIARHDPARVLAECDAKRRIVLLADAATPPDLDPATEHHAGNDGPWVGSVTLKLLALPYVDHPDYDERWRP